MSDLISRQEVITKICGTESDVAREAPFDAGWFSRLARRQDEIVNIIESLPSVDTDMSDYCDRLWKIAYERGKADRPTGWIPVSERLPDIGDTYLVTVMVGKEIRTDVADSFGSYIDGFWNTFNDWIEDEECHVIAWMPLPPAYQGEGGDSDG